MVLLIREWRIQPLSITAELMEINFSESLGRHWRWDRSRSCRTV